MESPLMRESGTKGPSDLSEDLLAYIGEKLEDRIETVVCIS